MDKRNSFVITARRTVTDPAERARRLALALQYILKDGRQAQQASGGKAGELGKAASA